MLNMLNINSNGENQKKSKNATRMWAYAQRDGRP